MKKALSLLLCFVLAFSLCSCSPSNSGNVVFLNKLIQCNVTESGKKFGFNLLYLYQGKEPDVSFTSFDNTNANALFEEMIDDTFESIDGKEYAGYRAVILGFCLDISPLKAGEELSINTITLSVNGREETLDTTGQITVKKTSDTDPAFYCNSVYSTNVPVVLFSQGKNIEAASFHYHTEHPVTLERFDFSDFLEVEKSGVYVDNQYVGSIEDTFPLAVEADKTVCIEIDANFGEYDSFSDYYVNSLLSYTSTEDGSKTVKDFVAIQAVGNFSDLSNLVDRINQK